MENQQNYSMTFGDFAVSIFTKKNINTYIKHLHNIQVNSAFLVLLEEIDLPLLIQGIRQPAKWDGTGASQVLHRGLAMLEIRHA